MTAEQLATLREKLAEATCAGERLPVLAEMVQLAAELRQAGGDDAASATALLDEALGQLRALAEAPADDGEYAFTLCLTAQACLLRDSGADLDDAIACLRELRDGLLAEPLPDREGTGDLEETGDPDDIMAEIEVSLGQALFERVSRPGGGVADLDDASAAVAAGLGRMASDAPARLALTTALALQYATRFVGYSGTQDHRRAALALAADCLAAPDAAEDAIAACHVIVAWMILTRQMTSEQRSSMLRQPEMEAARRGEPEATARITAMGEVHIDPADAETALSQLRQVTDAASLDGELSVLAPSLSSLAHLAIMRAGRVGEDVDQVADQLQSAARGHPPEGIEPGELLAMRAGLLAARASSDGRPDKLGPTAEAVQDAVALLPEGHLLRGPLLHQLSHSLRQQVDHAESADDFAAEIERIMDVLEQMPPDDPQFARTLTFAAVYLLGAQPAHRSAVPLDRLITQLERTVDRVAPDDPLRFLGESMRWGAIAARAVIEHRPDLVQAATSELIQCADRIPADSPVHPLVFLGATSGLIDRYVMTGELRLLTRAETYLGKASVAVDQAAAAAPVELSALRGLLLYLRSIIDVARVQHESRGQDLAELWPTWNKPPT